MQPIEVGHKALAFALSDSDGTIRHLKDYLGRPVVLHFYPEDDAAGCIEQACAFRALAPEFEALTAALVGIAPDAAGGHAALVEARRLPFPLLVDAAGRDGAPKVCDKYGAWREKGVSDAPGVLRMGVVRTTYLIDEAGKVARRWDAVEVRGHAEEVLAAVRVVRRGIPVFAR